MSWKIHLFPNWLIQQLMIGRGVAGRTALMLTLITLWIKGLYRKVTDGDTGFDLGRMVKIIIRKIGYINSTKTFTFLLT